MKKNLLTLDVALSKEIKYMLKEEHYLPGDKLPSERKLAELFHVQRLTVRGALNLLLQDKTIISKPRSGYYVAPKRILQSIRNFSLHSEEDSGQLTYELYDFKKIEADNYLASEMLLPEKSKIYKIVWLYSDIALELSSMGIRVDEDSLDSQLTEAGCDDRRELPFQKAILNKELPYTIGGGIGQSRICMFFLRKAHIGEVHASLWPEEVMKEAAAKGVQLL